MKKHITWDEIYERISALDLTKKYYGIPRGGQVIAGLTGNAVDAIEDADIVIDDLIDSGDTRERYLHHGKPVIGLFDKRTEFCQTWLVFPWETASEEAGVEDNVKRILQYFNEDTEREGLKDTPKRYIKFLKEFLSPPDFNFTTFDNENYDEMIVMDGIPFHSLCEHHMAPFVGVGHIGYVPNEKIVGLSKLARVLDKYSRRLQNQERITTQVAEFLMEELDAKGVAVVLRAEHMCMSMRGVKKHDTYTTTSKMIGVFKDDSDCRNEFLSFIKK